MSGLDDHGSTLPHVPSPALAGEGGAIARRKTGVLPNALWRRMRAVVIPTPLPPPPPPPQGGEGASKPPAPPPVGLFCPPRFPGTVPVRGASPLGPRPVSSRN